MRESFSPNFHSGCMRGTYEENSNSKNAMKIRESIHIRQRVLRGSLILSRSPPVFPLRQAPSELRRTDFPARHS